MIRPLTSYSLGIANDANNITKNGLYVYNITYPLENAMANIGVLLHMNGPDSRYSYQICCVTDAAGRMYFRIKRNDQWYAWQTIQFAS